MTDKKMLQEIVRLQDIFNSKLDADWRSKKWDWESSITVEIGEALESLQYKHWKDQELDLENVKVEAVDLLHFHVSKELESLARVTVVKYLLKYFTYNPMKLHPTAKGIATAREVFNDYNFYRSNSNLANIFRTLDMPLSEVYRMYVIKNVLNAFRADNGYKEGTYIKMWDGVEDNKVALAQWREGDTSQMLYSKLLHKYAEVKKLHNKI